MTFKNRIKKIPVSSSRELFNIDIFVRKWEEDGVYYVYSPALEIVGYGKSAKEAEDSFKHNISTISKYSAEILIDDSLNTDWISHENDHWDNY